MLTSPEPWQIHEGQQCYAFYPAVSVSRPWQAMVRIPWGREQWIVPLYVCPTPRLRRYTPEQEPGQQN